MHNVLDHIPTIVEKLLVAKTHMDSQNHNEFAIASAAYSGYFAGVCDAYQLTKEQRDILLDITWVMASKELEHEQE